MAVTNIAAAYSLSDTRTASKPCTSNMGKDIGLFSLELYIFYQAYNEGGQIVMTSLDL